MLCRICGEQRKPQEFFKIPFFTKYKKHDVNWCRDCQKMYMAMKKEEERKEKLLTAEKRFTVSFE